MTRPLPYADEEPIYRQLVRETADLNRRAARPLIKHPWRVPFGLLVAAIALALIVLTVLSSGGGR